MTNEERQKNLTVFLDNITTATGNTVRNDLYKTIINGIIYLRERDTIQVKINFR